MSFSTTSTSETAKSMVGNRESSRSQHPAQSRPCPTVSKLPWPHPSLHVSSEKTAEGRCYVLFWEAVSGKGEVDFHRRSQSPPWVLTPDSRQLQTLRGRTCHS